MKFGIRTPSLKKRIAARTSWKRYVRHNLGFKAPRGWGWLTNPKRAAYNRVYNRTTVSVDRLLSSGRRGRGGGGGATIVLAVIGVAAAAALGAYLLVGAAVLLIGWALRSVTKRPTEDAAPLEPANGTEPSMEYEQLADIEPNDFLNDERLKRAARIVFSAWARRMPKGPKHSDDLVRGIEVDLQQVVRLESSIEGRRFVERTVPARTHDAPSLPAVDVSTLDPWNPPSDLAAQTRRICVCGRCAGEGKGPCSNCGASGRVACLSCSGSGKYYGTTANGAHRMLNCKACKGKGRVACGACTKGVAQCATCESAKRLESWFDIEGWTRHDTRVQPEGESPADGAIVSNISTPGPIPASQLSAAVAGDLSRLSAALNPGERITSQTLIVVERPSVKVSYQVRNVTGSVTFVGQKMLAPTRVDEHAFASRAALLSRLELALLVVFVCPLVVYVARGSYFVTGRAAPLVAVTLAAAAGVALCLYSVAWRATLGRPVRSLGLVIVPLLALGTGAALAAEPSIERARGYLEAGRYEDTAAELRALGAEDDPSLTPTWAELWLKQALAAPSCADATAFAARISPGQSQRVRAYSHADALALADANRALGRGDLVAADAALGCASSGTRDGGEGRKVAAQIKLMAGDHCIASKDWDCVFARAREADTLGASSEALALRNRGSVAIQSVIDDDIAAARAEKDVTQRARVESAALALWSTYLASHAAKEPVQIAALKTASTRDQATIAHQEEVERQQAAAEERRRLAAERREQERQEAADRARAYSPLVCGDGTLSSSCVCGGNWRGCCSHHGGVSGCQGQ